MKSSDLSPGGASLASQHPPGPSLPVVVPTATLAAGATRSLALPENCLGARAELGGLEEQPGGSSQALGGFRWAPATSQMQGQCSCGLASPSLLGQRARSITPSPPLSVHSTRSISAAGNHRLPIGFSGKTAQAAGRADKWGLTCRD